MMNRSDMKCFQVKQSLSYVELHLKDPKIDSPQLRAELTFLHTLVAKIHELTISEKYILSSFVCHKFISNPLKKTNDNENFTKKKIPT